MAACRLQASLAMSWLSESLIEYWSYWSSPSSPASPPCASKQSEAVVRQTLSWREPDASAPHGCGPLSRLLARFDERLFSSSSPRSEGGTRLAVIFCGLCRYAEVRPVLCNSWNCFRFLSFPSTGLEPVKPKTQIFRASVRTASWSLSSWVSLSPRIESLTVPFQKAALRLQRFCFRLGLQRRSVCIDFDRPEIEQQSYACNI